MNTMRRFVLGVGLACWVLPVVLAGCNVVFDPSLRGSGVAKAEPREVAPFSEIEVGSAVQLDVTVGDPTSVVVTADDNILPLVRTEVVGDRLKIYVEGSTSTNIGVQVKVSMPKLKALVAGGASRISATGVAADQFQLELHGASTGELSGNAEVLDATLTGASRAVLSGTCNHLKVECAGASQLNATDFTADKVAVVASGASTVQVDAKEELTASVSGASHLHYTGQPTKLNKQVSGASTMSAK
jgi:hypothetical protein